MKNRMFALVRSSAVFLALSIGVTVYAQIAPTPTPSATPTPTATPLPVGQTITDLQSRIRQSLMRPDVRRGRVGVKIVSLATGKVIFEEDADKYFMPASNMKNFTVSTAIEKLTPDFRFITSVYAAAIPGPDGIVKGDLRVFGRGDVSMSTRFNGGDAFKGLDALVDKIVQAGVKKIEGDIVGDDSYFRGFSIPGGWEWDDLQWDYGAEVSALPLNDSVISVNVRPGPAGYACSVKMTPYNPVMRVTNRCITSPAGSRRNLSVHKRIDQNILEITGTMPANDGGWNGTVSVSRPAELFAALLKQRLGEKGVVITGNYRYEKRSDGSLPVGVEITKLESVPLSTIAANTMKPSQNMYTETLLWTLGEEDRKRIDTPTISTALPSVQKDSSELGIGVVRQFLTGIGVASDGIIQYDGSGLSRHNLITPAAVVQLYTYMGKQSRFSQAWRDSLTIGGVDGTLRNRFRGTRASGNVRGKTGTIDQVSALSGYIKTAAGEELVFSMVVNGVPENATRVSLIDEVVISLANYSGKID
jgi:D-alanyl-D-alanine carboxypeptidase/D-alanyl-D-alanine-endopeptidase (penicillin-binding protein 4)